MGARVPANGVLAPDVLPIPPLPPPSAATSRGMSLPVGKGEERHRVCVRACVRMVVVYGYVCVLSWNGLKSPMILCEWQCYATTSSDPLSK